MVSLETLAQCLRNGILLVRQAADTTTPLENIFDPDDATALRHLATIYCGDTAYTGYQRRAVTAAKQRRHSIHDLLRIEHHVRNLKNHNAAWKLREHLCGVPGERIDTEAAKQLKHLRPTPAPPALGVKILRGKDGAPDTLIYRGSSKNVTRLYDQLDQPDVDAAAARLVDRTGLVEQAEGNAPKGPDAFGDATVASGAADNAAAVGSAAASNDNGTAGSSAGSSDNAGPRYNLGDSRNHTPEAAPHIILTLDNVTSLQQGKDDVLLTLTNGARITGAEWAATRLYDIGFVTLLHPVEGPVNLYRTERFPNLKQRLMAAAEHPLCSWPGCRRPASRSQVHHLTAWKNGGETNAANLTILCEYHNAINNDDPELPHTAASTPAAVSAHAEVSTHTAASTSAAAKAVASTPQKANARQENHTTTQENKAPRNTNQTRTKRRKTRGRMERHASGVTWVPG